METGEERPVGYFREAARVELKTADLMIVIRSDRLSEVPPRQDFRDADRVCKIPLVPTDYLVVQLNVIPLAVGRIEGCR